MGWYHGVVPPHGRATTVTYCPEGISAYTGDRTRRGLVHCVLSRGGYLLALEDCYEGFGQEDVGHGEGGAEERGDVGVGEAGNAAADAGD